MLVRRFLRETGERVIPERVYEDTYDKLAGYLRGAGSSTVAVTESAYGGFVGTGNDPEERKRK